MEVFDCNKDMVIDDNMGEFASQIFPVIDGDMDLDDEIEENPEDLEETASTDWMPDEHDKVAIQRLHDNLGHPDLP
eukprot:2966235-Amphidinium_carterae.1